MNTWLLIDLEATCWENKTTPQGERQSVDTMEIIEIGCAVAKKSGELLGERSFIIRPTRNPILSAFCTELTSITQEMVDAASAADLTALFLDNYLVQLPDLAGWCSWGDYDRRQFEAQAASFQRPLDLLSLPHVNLKKLWAASTGHKKKASGLTNALRYHGLGFEGHLHRGVDDARNMARLLPFMDWTLKDQFTTAGQPLKPACYTSDIADVEFNYFYKTNEFGEMVETIRIRATVVNDTSGRFDPCDWIAPSALKQSEYNDELQCWEYSTRSRRLYRFYAPRDVVIPCYYFNLTPDVSSLFLMGARGKRIVEEYPEQVIHHPYQ